jgi:predicted Zn-dependent protease
MGEEPLELAERALSYTDGDAQVTVTHERSLSSRFARSSPTQATAVDDTTVEFVSLRDGHAAAATTNRLDETSLRTAARRAETVARVAGQGGPGDHPGLPSPATATPAEGWDAETAELDPGHAAAALRVAFAGAAAAGLEAFGLWTTGAVRTAIATSSGVRATDDLTDAFMKVVCRDADGRSGYAAQTARAVGELDADALTHRAVLRAPREDGIALGPGEYPVVLSADAVGVLLEFAAYLAFNGRAHVEGRGALTGRLGERVAAPSIDLSDTPASRSGLPRAYDAEGVPKRAVPLIEDGVARAVVHDLRSAALAGDGARSTGHAIEPGSSFGPVPTNLVLAGGDAADEDALAAPVERGIYVTRLWYVNVVHERQTLLTGMTRDGTFLIEDGKIGPPVRDVRFTDSVLRILEATEELTAAQRLVSEGEFYGRRAANGVVCPALRAQGFRVTGATR